MKYGIEVEGRLKGVPTIFVGADEFVTDPDSIYKAMRDHSVSHLYISDPDNIVPYTTDFGKILVTLDMTRVRYDNTRRPANVLLMLRIDPAQKQGWEFADLVLLRDGDQIKFERNQFVFVFPWSARIATNPSEFVDDITL